MAAPPHLVDAYAHAVVEGELPAGKYHRLSCARHLRDREREGSADFPYRFEPELVARFVRFAAALKHYKGEWAGQPIRLEPHQIFRLGSILGWLEAPRWHAQEARPLRRFRTAYNEIPRKNGKSLEAALVALYLTFFDNEPGAEGYTIATKREQAKIVFSDCQMLVRSSGLSNRIAVRVARLLGLDDPSLRLEPLGADHDSTDGLNPHVIITDELHAHKTRGLIDVMETATGARRQPMHFQITTAGDSLVSPCGDQHEYAVKILERTIVDETFFAFIAHADAEDDWTLEATWRKANPNYAVSVQPADLRALAFKARNMPAAAATFKQKRLNVWVNTSQPWLSMNGWREGQSRGWSLADLRFAPCYVGLDLAGKLDLCSLVAVFPPAGTRRHWRLLPYVWTPEETLADRAHRDRAPYTVWRDQGYLRTTPGRSVDHSVIRPVLAELREQVELRQVGYDPWHADLLIDQLKLEDGFPDNQLIEVPQTYKGMSAAALEFEAAVAEGLVDAGDNPLLGWCASNAVVQRDGKDNIQPIKKNSRGRIDPIVAAVIATSLKIRQHESTIVDPNRVPVWVIGEED